MCFHISCSCSLVGYNLILKDLIIVAHLLLLVIRGEDGNIPHHAFSPNIGSLRRDSHFGFFVFRQSADYIFTRFGCPPQSLPTACKALSRWTFLYSRLGCWLPIITAFRIYPCAIYPFLSTFVTITFTLISWLCCGTDSFRGSQQFNGLLFRTPSSERDLFADNLSIVDVVDR